MKGGRNLVSLFVVASCLVEATMAQGTPTTSAETTVATPLLQFLNIGQPTTCGFAVIEWFYAGVDAEFSFTVTNSGVPQDSSVPPRTSTEHFATDGSVPPGLAARAVPTGANDPIPVTSLTIETNIDGESMEFTWDPVDVASGWYTIVAVTNDLSYSTTSPSFFVYNGTDSSCLGTSTSTIAPTSSATSSQALSSSSASSAVSSNTAVAVGGASTSSSKVSTGAIAGIIIGALVVVAACLLAWLLFYRKGRKTRIGAPGIGRWNGLNSRSGSQHDFSTRSLGRPSIATMPMSPSEEAVTIGAEKNSIHSQASLSDGRAVALSAMPVLQNQVPRSRSAGGINRTYSTSSSVSNAFASSEYTTSPSGRRPSESVPDSFFGGKPSIDSTTYPPSSPHSPHSLRNSAYFIPPTTATHSDLGTSTTHQTSNTGLLHQPTSPSTSTSTSASPSSYPDSISPVSPSDNPARQGNRQSLGAKKRKPVPTYDPSSERGSPVPSLPASSSPSPIPPPSPAPGDHAPHYTTRSQAGHDHSRPELVHKSSFGPGGIEGKALHYLIPDMPMPLKD